jgi:hypothetical protein
MMGVGFRATRSQRQRMSNLFEKHPNLIKEKAAKMNAQDCPTYLKVRAASCSSY